jgi:hypothetical protein
MNDPHIETLYYNVDHAKGVDYAKADPLSRDMPGFTGRIENGRCEVTMKTHHATVETARAEVEPFLRAWEMTAALAFTPGELRFFYHQFKMIDRDPLGGRPIVPGSSTSVDIAIRISPTQIARSKYPDPPVQIARDATVDLMFERYCLYRWHRTTLADAVNYCITALVMSGGRRSGAARRFGVAKTVLNKAGELAGKKGGIEARKAQGAAATFTIAERQWLEEAIKRLILRAGEVAGNPSASFPQITMVDLPPL